MMIIETIDGKVICPEFGRAGEGITDREAVRALLATAPLGAFLVVIAGWVLGSIAGGWLAARIAGRSASPTAWGWACCSRRRVSPTT
jgi:hypothetical protein